MSARAKPGGATASASDMLTEVLLTGWDTDMQILEEAEMSEAKHDDD